MTHVVTKACDGCRYTDCVVVCPVECFYEVGEDKMIYIHPDECIDCEACVPECPVEAIFHEDDVPDDMQDYVKLNADKCEDSAAENITEKKDPLCQDLGFESIDSLRTWIENLTQEKPGLEPGFFYP